ncbi:hypothetical protein R1sor_000119 [Riccia sorocarpa]|uniref:Reverse transcriptase zinc-binding domain-containing protein n=1 Tax=Riccia sorocarpa TaxID=122646 RepID=A0ABD3GS69_9MARC
MDIDSMKNPTRRKLMREAWEEEWTMSPDPVLAWELAWGRARELFTQFHKEDREKLSKLKENQTALEVMWDASSKYFFSCLKSKQTQEKITSLMDGDGRKVEDEDQILSLVHSYYQGLYTQIPDTVDTRNERKLVLDLLKGRVQEQENQELAAPPEAKEILELVEALPNNKAPGEDSLTAEVLHFVYNERTLNPLLKKLKCSSLVHLQAHKGDWRDLRRELGTVGHVLTTAQEDEIRNFQQFLLRITTDAVSLQSSKSWRWHGDTLTWTGWVKHSRFWGKLLDKTEVPEDLSTKWRLGGESHTWAQRWRLLWKCKASTRTKLWIWRTLKHGFYTGDRAEKMGKNEGSCVRCRQALETTEHLFWGCPQSSAVWSDLRTRAACTGSTLHVPSSFVDTIDEAIFKGGKGCSLLHIIAPALQSIWKSRNAKLFQDKNLILPIDVILQEAKHEAEGVLNEKAPEERWVQGLQILKDLSRLLREAELNEERVASASPSPGRQNQNPIGSTNSPEEPQGNAIPDPNQGTTSSSNRSYV